jgi:hypothetical protein
MAETLEPDRIEHILWAVRTEVQEAIAAKGPFNSNQEEWAQLAHEVNKLLLEIDLAPHRRNLRRMQTKAVRIAATAVRFILNAQ